MQDPTPVDIVIKPFAALVARRFTKGELHKAYFNFIYTLYISQFAELIQTNDLSLVSFVRKLSDQHRFGKCMSGYTLITENISKYVIILENICLQDLSHSCEPCNQWFLRSSHLSLHQRTKMHKRNVPPVE